MTSQSPAFVGRQSELDQIRAILDTAREGIGRFVLIEGEPGIGKSALVNELTADAPGFDTHVGRANHLERDIPFALLTTWLRISGRALDDRRRSIATMIETPRGGGLVNRRFQVSELVVDLIESMALDAPLLLIVEDLHWVDEASAATIARIAERCRDLALVLMCTTRSTGPETTSDHVIRTAIAPLHLRLSPLEPGDVSLLAASMLEATAGPNLQRSLEAAGGNPLFARELISEIGRAGVLKKTEEGVDLTALSLPPSLRLVILRHVSRLEADTVDLLRTAAVLDRPFSAEDLAMLHDLEPLAVARSVEAARRADILVDSEEGLRFRHDLIREAIYEDISSTARRTMHRHIARVMLANGRDARRLITHITLGAVSGDHESAGWVLAAAREVATTSPGEATYLYEQVLEIAPTEFEQRSSAEAELVDTLVWGRDPARGEAMARELLSSASHPDRDTRSSIAISMMRAVMLQGKTSTLTSELGDVIRVHKITPTAQALLLAESALTGSGSRSEHENATAAAKEAIALAEAASATAARGTALCALSHIRMYVGDLDGSIQFAREAVGLANQSGDADALRRAPNYYLASSLMFVDEVEEAERLYVEGMKLAEQLGSPWSLPVYHFLLSEAHRMVGRWDDSVAECEASVGLSEQLGATPWIVPARAHMAVAHVHRDELEQAREQIAACDELIGSTHTPLHASWGRMVLLAACGDVGAAATVGESLHREMSGSEHWFTYRLFGMDLVRTLLAAGKGETAKEVVAVLERLVPKHPAWSPRAIVMHARALLMQDAGLALEAVETFRKSPRITEAAWAAEDAALMIAHTDEKRAISLLEEAVAAHASTGLARDEARLVSLLRSFGVRRGPRRAKKRVKSGWDALTRSELKVAHLVAQGLTNPSVAERLFISRRTVDAHLSHIYTKLGISSRAQLAAQVAVRVISEGEPAL